jgi:hypothetical protein
MNRPMNRPAVAFIILLAYLAAGAKSQNGRDLIEESLRRHAPPAYIYEEQALVLTDRLGQHTVRTARFYARQDENGSKSRWVIETPAESKGTAISIERTAARATDNTTARGARHGASPVSPVFGSNFLVADLEGEQPRDFHYERDDDHDVERVPHYVIRAIPADEFVARATGYHERRVYLRKDNLFITRIDYQDREGRPARRQTFRDPQPDESGAWRAGMILMEDLRDGRRTLLKIERRVHSADYVPATVFAGLPAHP